jgi:hypothetical protein
MVNGVQVVLPGIQYDSIQEAYEVIQSAEFEYSVDPLLRLHLGQEVIIRLEDLPPCGRFEFESVQYVSESHGKFRPLVPFKDNKTVPVPVLREDTMVKFLGLH